MKMCRKLTTAGVSLLVYSSCLTAVAWGDCRLERNDDGAEVMMRRLVGTCTSDERLTLAVNGEDVIRALQDGRGVDLHGVVLAGDVMLDRLPVEEVTSKDLSIPLVGERLFSGHIEGVRRLRGPLILRHVEVQGVIATNFVMQGYLLAEGPVKIQDTMIQRSIDFSRTAFLEDVEFSGSNILYEGFFIQTVFTKGANFKTVNFGTHSRFHKAVFGGKAVFTGCTFQGLAEFLEVVFQQEAGFSNVHFAMGTGFSGSRFQQQATFTRAVFDREAYFRFAEFDGDAQFQGVSFGAATDFTEAKFRADWNFAGAKFAVAPQFPKAQAGVLAEHGNRWKDARVQSGLFAFLLIVIMVVIFRSRRPSGKKSPKSSKVV